MAEFNFDSLDISRVNNETIAELGEILWQYTSVHCQEDIDIAEKYRDSVDALTLWPSAASPTALSGTGWFLTRIFGST